MDNLEQILIIDDEEGNRQALHKLLEDKGYSVRSSGSGEEAQEILKKTNFSCILTDLRLPGISGLEILKQVKAQSPYTNVILITGQGSAETAVEAMKNGAFDYITKPLNFGKLQLLVENALEKSRLVAENLYLREQLRHRYAFNNIIGHSEAMEVLFDRLERVVHTDSTVLVLGESGTGKELVSRAIHFNSLRRDQPFIAINCSAIPTELLESELFGHTRGSFTGAVADKPGHFERAQGGTLFLDEIGTMPVHLQTKLLRVLQEQEVQRVGSSKAIKLDVRVISATNTNLEELIKQGQFREDLYYRLNVIPIHLPPLRQRQEDIALLARHFLQKCCQELQQPLKSLTPGAMATLESYHWPGNVREMENVIERTVALTDGNLIQREDLPPHIGGGEASGGDTYAWKAVVPDNGMDMPGAISRLERQLILQALKRSGGIKSRAAALLGINRTTLVEKIKRLGLQQQAQEAAEEKELSAS